MLVFGGVNCFAWVGLLPKMRCVCNLSRRIMDWNVAGRKTKQVGIILAQQSISSQTIGRHEKAKKKNKSILFTGKVLNQDSWVRTLEPFKRKKNAMLLTSQPIWDWGKPQGIIACTKAVCSLPMQWCIAFFHIKQIPGLFFPHYCLSVSLMHPLSLGFGLSISLIYSLIYPLLFFWVVICPGFILELLICFCFGLLLFLSCELIYWPLSVWL